MGNPHYIIHIFNRVPGRKAKHERNRYNVFAAFDDLYNFVVSIDASDDLIGFVTSV